MKLASTFGLLSLAGLLAAPLFAASTSSIVGKKPSYTFREAPVNAMGVKSLSDLRGKPVLVEFWGTK